ncbi:DUF2306 domain-containing protein [Zavarzinia compransoris]|uniref:DUF2306 domain-containing protein n=1 Tax=Zavarzinia marina TaxID=2911065 RepID=UPI001F3B10A9|nr:DUF2306 domain-containing protein [Zavarzinia marina]MCF4167405.1 DUF2306 domain-containing protein [Zavarzinia marina]
MSLAHNTLSSGGAVRMAALRLWTLRGLAAFLALFVGAYGIVAIDMGLVNFSGAENADIAAQRRMMVEAAESGDDAAANAGVIEHSGLGLALVAEATSPRFAYGEQGLSEPLIHYAEMPAANAYVLSVHNVVGGLAMLFGALQFWPAFRRRFPRWHRGFGFVYLIGASIGMVTAMVYMTMTPVARMYDELTFTVGLWILAVGTLASLWLAMLHLWRRQIPQHQAYMAISYGFLLTAPFTRYFWVLVGLMGPDLRQLEANYAGTAWLLPFCFLASYGIFTVTRLQAKPLGVEPLRKAMAEFPGLAAAGPWLAGGLIAGALLAAVAAVQHFAIAPGLSNFEAGRGLVPPGVVALDAAVIGADGPFRLIFTGATVAGLLIGAHILHAGLVQGRAVGRAAGYGLAIASAIAGATMLRWGIAMGLPSFATLAGGATWAFAGTAALVFSALVALALAMGWQSFAREWCLFAVLCLIGPPALYALLPVWGMVGIPASYVETGHLYRLATYSEGILLFAGFAYSIYGQATRERVAR